MNWTQWIANLLAAGVGAFVASLIAYRTSYSAKKGEHRADYEDIAFLLGKERGTAYEQETGKRFATHDDIENVLKEVKAVTHETETIKAQIGSNLWLRQTVWAQKHENYSAALKGLNILQDRLNFLRGTRKIIDELKTNDPNHEPSGMQAQLTERLGEFQQAHRKVLDALTEAEIFMPGMKDFRTKFQKIDELKKAVNLDSPLEQSSEASSLIDQFRSELIVSARSDLGMELPQ